MDLMLFYYTLVIMLVSVLTAGACFSVFLVTRKRGMAFLTVAFLLYFIDVALVFQDDFILRHMLEQMDSVYVVASPLASIVTGGGIFASIWFFICDFFREKRRWVLALPGGVFAACSLAVLLFIPEGNIHQFLFYSMRGVILFGMLVYIAVRYVGASEAVRDRLRKGIAVYWTVWIFGILVVAENVVFQLVVDPELVRLGVVPFLPERNFAENLMVMSCAVFVFKYCFNRLGLCFRSPMEAKGPKVSEFIDDGMAPYCDRYGLSVREAEVLRMVLSGMDNQNIASAMNLAPGTVKVHVHNILRKTGQGDRQELKRHFRQKA